MSTEEFFNRFEALTFDDVVIVPGYSDVLPDTVDTTATFAADIVSGFDPNWVVLAGWMRILSMSFLGWFPGMVVNLHPALPGELPGVDAIERAWHEAQSGRRNQTGVMVHLVPNEGIDDGPVLATATVSIHPSDSLESLTNRVHGVEHRLLVETLATLCTTGANA